jgi:hypothetical protein
MDELQRYLARRRRRLRFAITVRDHNDPARWARLQFEVVFPWHAVVVVNGRTYESGLSDLWVTHLGLVVDGSELVDVEDRMARAGWTTPFDHSGRSSKHYSFQRPLPPDDTPATLAAIARGAATAVLGTDQHVLTIEPYQGFPLSYIYESAGYRSLLTMAGFVISTPVVVTFAVLLTHSPLEGTLVFGALVTIAMLYLLLMPGREPARLPPTLEVDVVLLRLEMAVGESAIVELPIIGPLIERFVSLNAPLVGVWVPVVVAIVITLIV